MLSHKRRKGKKMKVLKGQIVKVDDKKKGVFKAKAAEDFDTETAEYYQVILIEPVKALKGFFDVGDAIYCDSDYTEITFSSDDIFDTDKLYLYRRNCDILSDFLSRYDECEFPDYIYSSIVSLMSILDYYVSNGYSYQVVKDENGDIDFIYSEPNSEV